MKRVYFICVLMSSFKENVFIGVPEVLTVLYDVFVQSTSKIETLAFSTRFDFALRFLCTTYKVSNACSQLYVDTYICMYTHRW